MPTVAALVRQGNRRRRYRGWLPPRRRCPAALVALLLALTGCGTQQNGPGGGPGGGDSGERDDGGSVLLAPEAAAAVLTAFDQADSAASAAGNVDGLRSQEVSPALDASIAAVNRARYQQRVPPTFRHSEPVFAIPRRGERTDQPDCFLVAASLQLAGSEMKLSDVSQFLRQPGGGWKLSHNVNVGQANVTAARGLADRPAEPATALLDEARRRALADEVFHRTTAARPPDIAVVASSTLLDRQFAAGWDVYQRQLADAGMAANRTLRSAEWSACAARSDAGVIAFLTLHSVDTVTSTRGGAATLGPTSPDLIGLGQTVAVSGPAVAIARVQVFLLLVPPNTSSAAVVLGLGDAPLTVTANR